MPSSFKIMLYRLRLALTHKVLKPHAQPKPITFVGPGAVKQLCDGIGHFGLKKIFMVTDKPLVELGLIDGAKQALEEGGVEVVVYDGVLPDPTFKIINEGLALLKSSQCDGVMAFGGGSSMDAGKIMALAAANNIAPEDLVGFGKAKLPTLPLFAIPTTAGTGSEVTLVAVPSDDVTHAKQPIADNKLVPTACALDPTIMTGLPPHITSATGMDALTHAIESYIGTWGTLETESLGSAAVKLIFKHLPIAYEEGSNLASREAMSLASYYAGLAFSKAMVGFVHAISHQLGAHYGIPHGLANAVVLPHVLEYSKDAAQQKMAQLVVSAGLGDASEGEAALAQKLIDMVVELNDRVDIPRGFEQIKPGDIAELAADACKEGNGYPVPKYMDVADCSAILEGLIIN
ncbi:MAG: iron-containing alcohol dehydrogenase [Proteobacteria bacterium]|nr:iron-containing alcohol dehydrogenase [Pseudomonadota bacterium]